MPQKRTEERTVKTPEFRAAFPHMFQPQPPMAGSSGPGKYSCVLLFPKDTDLGVLKQAARIAAEDQWGDQLATVMNSPEFTLPFNDGDAHNDKREAMGKPRLAGYDGCIYMTVTSLEKPPLVDQAVQPIISQEEFYAGCYGIAQLYFHAYNTAGNIGVTAFLNMVQKTRDGDKFSGRKAATDVFDSIPGASATPAAADTGASNPTAATTAPAPDPFA